MIIFYEHLIIIAFFAYIVGFLISVPIGAVQIEVAKRAINNHLKSAYMVALGSVFSDIIYGIIASFSITSFLDNIKVKATLIMFSGFLLAFLAVIAFRDALKSQNSNFGQIKSKSYHISIITGFSMSFTNPLMIIFWVIYVQFSYDIGIIPYYNAIFLIIFVFFSGAGLFSYLFFIAKILNHVRKSFSIEFIKKVNIILSIVLTGFACYFIIRAIQLFRFVM